MSTEKEMRKFRRAKADLAGISIGDGVSMTAKRRRRTGGCLFVTAISARVSTLRRRYAAAPAARTADCSAGGAATAGFSSQRTDTSFETPGSCMVTP